MKDAILPLHVAVDGFGTEGDCLVMGGRTIPQLAEELGSTPFYAYERRLIDRRLQRLRDALPADMKLHYAVKANPMPDVVRHIAAQVDGLDVASAAELVLALGAGALPADISFAGPGKTVAELRAAIAAGIVINIESPTELQRIADIAGSTGARPQIAVRVNPDYELRASGMKMAGGPKQFGVDAEQVPDLMEELARLPVELVGFHIFSGSQSLNTDAICEAQRKTLELALRLARHVPRPLHHFNIGGGFGIPYFPGDKPLELERIGANLAQLLDEFRDALGDTELVLELGRYIVGEAGIYVCRVIDRKVSRGQVFLVCDGGLHHHLAASGNFGQVIRRNYPVLIGNRVFDPQREVVSAVGPLCTPLDLLADKMELAKAEIGDYLVVFQSGAYGFTASPTAFLSHPPPLETLL